MIAANLDTLSPDQLRDAVRVLLADVASKSAEIAFKQATIDKLAHEMAVLKRLKFAAKSEAFNAEQKSLIEETIDTDLAALALEIEQRAPSKDPGDKQQPKRAVLPSDLPRTEHRHEPQTRPMLVGTTWMQRRFSKGARSTASRCFRRHWWWPCGWRSCRWRRCHCGSWRNCR